ncbi:MAG TPA: hypothetical protein PKL15_03150 [Saprospiraceae bacterium]|nr:hypothetical protein [Saprospiraceae bacterium]
MAGIGTSSTCQAVHELPQEEIKRLLGALKKKALISREYGRALVLLKFLLALKTTLQRHPRHKSGRLNEVELQQKLFSQEDAKGERLIEKAKKIILDTIKANKGNTAGSPETVGALQQDQPEAPRSVAFKSYLSALLSDDQNGLEKSVQQISAQQITTFIMLQASIADQPDKCHPLLESFINHFEASGDGHALSPELFFYRIYCLQKLPPDSAGYATLLEACYQALLNAPAGFADHEYKAAEYLLRSALLARQNRVPSSAGFEKIWRLFKSGWDQKRLSPSDKISLTSYFNIARAGYECREYQGVRGFTGAFSRFFSLRDAREARRVKQWFDHLIDVAQREKSYAPDVKLKSKSHNIFFRTTLICEYFDDPACDKEVLLSQQGMHFRYLSNMEKLEKLDKQLSIRFKNFFEMVGALIALRFDISKPEERAVHIEALKKSFEEKKNGQLTQTLWLQEKIGALEA